MANITLATGTVKYPAGKEFESKHADCPNRINLVVTLTNGEEVKVWGTAGGSLTLYKKGEPIQLVFDGKNYQAMEELTPPVQAESASVPSLASTQPPEWAEAAWDDKLELCATRYGKAIGQAKAIAYRQLRMSAEAFDDPAGKQVVQAIALSLYIEVNQR
jgi:hypothetical protein